MTQDNRSRSQRYAEQALKKIKDVQADERDEYKARADGFPVMVMQAGLAQAAGFMIAQGAEKPVYRRYFDDLAAVLGASDGKALQDMIIGAELPEYRRLTRQALAVATWFKRFGQAYLSDKTGGRP